MHLRYLTRCSVQCLQWGKVMTEKDIKPIPKRMLKKIRELDLQEMEKSPWYPSKALRFYAYLTTWKKELVKVTVAVKYRYNKFVYKQVAVHSVCSENCYVKDIHYNSMAGYRVGWYEEGFSYYPRWYENGWICVQSASSNNPFAPIVNKDFLGKLPEYKYSGYELYGRTDIINYLRQYKKYPVVEYFMKMDLSKLIFSKLIVKKAMKDKSFRRWLFKNIEELKLRSYDKTALVMAFRQNKSLPQIQEYLNNIKAIRTYGYRARVKELFGSYEKFFAYIKKQKTNFSSYNDYFDACTELSIDLREAKNYRPHDFKYWHDVRTDQYAKIKTVLDAKKRKKMMADFIKVAKKYESLQDDKEDLFICVIAKSISQLVKEGRTLHHCVGRMNYDAKFAREESLIFFVRNKETPTKPYVTVEYSLKQKRILQCYGDGDTTPETEVLHYVHQVWLPYANMQLEILQKGKTTKKLAA